MKRLFFFLAQIVFLYSCTTDVVSVQDTKEDSVSNTNEKETTNTKMPWGYYHFSQSNQYELIDSLIFQYESESKYGRMEIIDFIIDSVVSKSYDSYPNAIRFLTEQERCKEYTLSQKQRIMDMLVSNYDSSLLPIFSEEKDSLFRNQLKNKLYYSNKISEDIIKQQLRLFLFEKNDDDVVLEWIRELKSGNYRDKISNICNYPRRRDLFDELMIVLKEHHDEYICCVDHLTGTCTNICSSVMYIMSQHFAMVIKDFPEIDHKTDLKTENRKNGRYTFTSKKYTEKVLSWCETHQNNYQFIEK